MHLLQVTCLAFTADGQLLASADQGGHVCTWDLAAGKQLASAKQHAGPVWSLAASHGRALGSALASGGLTLTLRERVAAASGDIAGESHLLLCSCCSSEP